MAVHFATGSDYLQRTVDLLDPTADSTVMLWVRYQTEPTTYATPYVALDEPVLLYLEWAGIYEEPADAPQDSKLSMTGFYVGTPAAPAGSWMHVAWVQEGTTQRFYQNGVLIGTGTLDRSGFTVGVELLGNDTYSDGDLDISNFRSWQAALTQAEIATEMYSVLASRTTNLFQDTPLPSAADLTDYSGNARDWTAIGSLTSATSAIAATVGRKQPRRWVFFALDTVPPTLPVPTYRWAQRPIVYQAFPAFIEGRVQVDGWLDIVRAASSMSGEYNIDHGAVLLNDADALIRALLDDYATQWFLKRQGHFLLLSDAAIRAGLLPPRILFCGPCSDVQVLDNRTAQLDFEDVLARFMDREYPQYTLGDAYPYLFTEPDVIPPEDLNETDPGLQIPKLLRDQVIPTIYGPFVESRTDPLTGLAVQQRMCPVFFMGFLAGNFGDSGDVGEFPPELADLMSPFGPEENWGNWGELVVCSGEEQIPNVSVSNLQGGPAEGSPPVASEPVAPVLLSEDRYGVDVMAPGHPGWPFATNSVLRNGYRLTVIYARGPVLWHHITGICPINVDVCGWPDEENVPIDQAFFGWQSFVDQHVLAHDGAGYTSGPQTGLTMFDPTVDIDRSMIWTSKIQTAQSVSATRLGNVKGYLISMGLWKKTALREIDRTFNVTFDSFTAKNSAGQVYKFLIDDTAAPDTGVPIRERIELLNLPAPKIDWPAMENEIDYTVGLDPKLDSPRTITITIRDQASIDAMKGDVRKVDGIRDLRFTADDDTATDTMARRLMRLRQPPRYQPLPMRTNAVDREIGEQVRITHRDGFGPRGVGYSLRPMVLLNSVHRGDHITMDALDLYQTLVEAARWAEDAVPDWDAATPEEQAANGFWTDDEGLIDGDRGTEWR